MDKEKIRLFLLEHKGQFISITKGDSEEFIEMVNYCLDKGYIRPSGNSNILSANGLDFLQTMTDKPLRVRVLEYLKDKDAVDTKIDIGLPFLEADDSTEARGKLRNALEYLSEEKFIKLTGEPINMLSKQAGQHPPKYHTGLKASITPLGCVQIGPIEKASIDKPTITNTYHLDGAISPIIGDNNSPNFKAHTIKNTTNSDTNLAKMNPVIKWVLGTISAIIAGIVVWYLTKG